MAPRPTNKETIKKHIIRDMGKLGVFKAEYTPLIDIYSELMEQYMKLTKEYKDGGFKYAEETDRGGTKKSTLVATLETLRKDLLAYSDRLCLNPKSLSDKEKDDNNKKGNVSALALVLKDIEKG